MQGRNSPCRHRRKEGGEATTSTREAPRILGIRDRYASALLSLLPVKKALSIIARRRRKGRQNGKEHGDNRHRQQSQPLWIWEGFSRPRSSGGVVFPPCPLIAFQRERDDIAQKFAEVILVVRLLSGLGLISPPFHFPSSRTFL